MWLPIISSLITLAIMTLLFTPELRKFPMYKSLTIFFFFEGLYSVLNFIITEIWSNFTLMSEIHDIGCVICGIYVLISIFSYRQRNKITTAKADIDTQKGISR